MNMSLKSSPVVRLKSIGHRNGHDLSDSSAGKSGGGKDWCSVISSGWIGTPLSVGTGGTPSPLSIGMWPSLSSSISVGLGTKSKLDVIRSSKINTSSPSKSELPVTSDSITGLVDSLGSSNSWKVKSDSEGTGGISNDVNLIEDWVGVHGWAFNSGVVRHPG